MTQQQKIDKLIVVLRTYIITMKLHNGDISQSLAGELVDILDSLERKK